MKKVLMIAYYFPPLGGAGVFRTLKFTKYLPRFHWAPIILTVDIRNPTSVDPSLLNELQEVTAVYRVPYVDFYQACDKFQRLFFPKAVKNIWLKQKSNRSKPEVIAQKKQNVILKLRRWFLIPDEQIGWLPLAFFRGLRIIREEKIDVLYSTGGPWTDHLIGYLLKKATGKPWIADFRDPWTLSRSFWPPTSVHRSLEEWLEFNVLKAADSIIINTGWMHKAFVNKYPFIGNKSLTIPNGYDNEDFSELIPIPQRRFNITYTGVFYSTRNPHTFLLALKEIVDESEELRGNLAVNFLGLVDKKTENIIEQLGLRDIVQIKGYVSHKECMQYLIDSDVLLLIMGTLKGSELYVPGKAYEYIKADKPILALIPEVGAAADLLRASGLGIIVNPSNIVAIKEILYKLYRRINLNIKANPSVIKEFDREELTKKLVSELNRFVQMR